MKKKVVLFLLVLFLVILIGCEESVPTETNPTEETEVSTTPINNQTMLKKDLDFITINNSVVELKISQDDGSLISIINLNTGRNFLDNQNGENWSLLIDPTTNNYYNSNSKNAINISNKSFSPEITYSEGNDTLSLKLSYQIGIEINNEMIDGITIDSIFTIQKNNPEILIDYRIDNQLDVDNVIINFTGLTLSGIQDKKESLNLFYSFREGKVYEKAVSKALNNYNYYFSKQYPMQYSMQLLQLYDQTDSLYYYVKDDTREYKLFTFGNVDGKVQLSCTQYPFVSRGEEKNLWTTVLGIDSENSWYSGSDSYRDFLIKSEMDRDYNSFVQEWTGFTGSTICEFGKEPVIPYVGAGSPDKSIENIDNFGLDSIVLFGWHEGGFDSRYPDYTFFEGEGYGYEGFKQMVENAHENGDKIIPYLNAHITATNSQWGMEKNLVNNIANIADSAIKKEGFNPELSENEFYSFMYEESYGTSIKYYATCPASESFLSQIEKVVESLADANVDGLWMDQMMEMPAYLCYDESHNHKTPATAYGEGYAKMYAMIDEVFESHNIEHLIFAEGVADAWIEYIDICGYMWGRPLYAESQSPNLTLYTMPCKFLGIESYNTQYNHAHAFLYGMPYKEANTIDATVIKMFEENKDIYMYGRFMDSKGINYQNNNVLNGVILAENAIGVQLYNNSSKDQTIFMQVDLEDLGIEGEITKITNLFNDEIVQFTGNKVTIKIEPSGMVALRIEYEVI